MKQSWFQFPLWTLTISVVAGIILLTGSPRTDVPAQQTTDIPLSATVAPPSGMFITVTGTEGANIRSGPNSYSFPMVGHLQMGDTAQAVGVTPSHDWIQIVAPQAPGGYGWVYIGYVSLSPGSLRVIEPPPTPAPATTPTIDLTLEAQFNLQSTPTRLPTFTPPAPLPTNPFGSGELGNAVVVHFPWGVTIISLALLGAVGLIASFFFRRN